MGKIKQFIMRAFTVADTRHTKDKIEIECADLKLKEVRLGYNFLCDAFTKHYEVEDNLITDIFKLTLPADEDNAMRFCEEGVLLNGERYFGWFSSTSMMKDEDFEEDTKCEMLFIKEDKLNFKLYFERLITLGKVDSLYSTNVKMCKDYLSRLSLATSTSSKITYQPNVIVLPELNYKHVANYKVPALTDNGIVLEDRPEFEVEHVFSDGGGIMSPRLAQEIQHQMGLDYEVAYCIFRHYPMAMKGGLIKVDFIEFFNEFYVHDTDTFRRINDTFEVKDIFGNWRSLHEADIIVNESCAKWYKHWKGQSHKDVYDKINELKPIDRDLMKSIYITKVNKKECKKMSLANYQLLGNLSLTYDDMQKLSSYTEGIYKRILDDDINMIKLFLKDIVKQDIEDVEPEEVVPSTKMKALLNIDERFINLGYVQKNKARLINKKVRELCGGKFYINADWKYMVADPITFLNTMMYGYDNKEVVYHNSSLKDGEFYIYNNANQEVALERCPLNCYNEVRKVTIVTNGVYEKYMPKCEELIIFNQSDNLHLDGDFDGDICLVVRDKVIIDNIVECEDEGKKWWFFNPDDDKASAVEMEFNDHNKFLATIKASGNDICRLANWGMILSSDATSVYRYVSKRNKEYTHEEAMKKIKDTKWYTSREKSIKGISDKNERSDELRKLNIEAYEQLQSIIKDGELVLSKVKRNDISNALLETTKIGFYLLRLQQLGIDKSKTLKPIPEHEFKYAQEIFKGIKKPRFLKYIKEEVKFSEYTLNPLNMNGHRIATGLYREDIENMDAKDNAWILYPYLHTTLEEDEVEVFEELKEILKDVYDTHNKEANKIRMSHVDKDTKNIRYRQQDADTILLCKDIEEKYGYRLVAYACERLKLTDRFIINYMWNTLESCFHVDKASQFVECEDGEFEWLGKRYNKTYRSVSLDDNLQSEAIQRAYKTMCIASGETRIRLLQDINEGDVFSIAKTDKEPQLVNQNTGEIIGSIFIDRLQISDTVNINDVDKIKIESIKQIAKNRKSATVIVTTI